MSAIKPYLDQRYEEIKQKCQQSGKLFKDESFPANDTIVPNDLDQGAIGDWYYISILK